MVVELTTHGDKESKRVCRSDPGRTGHFRPRGRSCLRPAGSGAPEPRDIGNRGRDRGGGRKLLREADLCRRFNRSGTAIRFGLRQPGERRVPPVCEARSESQRRIARSADTGQPRVAACVRHPDLDRGYQCHEVRELRLRPARGRISREAEHDRYRHDQSDMPASILYPHACYFDNRPRSSWEERISPEWSLTT